MDTFIILIGRWLVAASVFGASSTTRLSVGGGALYSHQGEHSLETEGTTI